MGQHKRNKTAILAKEGKIKPIDKVKKLNEDYTYDMKNFHKTSQECCMLNEFVKQLTDGKGYMSNEK